MTIMTFPLQHPRPFHLLTWLNAGIGVAMLIWNITTGSLPMGFQIGYFTTMIAVTGIPHGALDHVIARVNDKHLNKRFSMIQFLVKYLLAMSLYAMCWIGFPSISLLIFLIISAWHFGETDIANVFNNLAWNVSRLLWGCFVLLLILLTHQQESIDIISRITHYESGTQQVIRFFTTNASQVLIGLGISSCVLIGYCFMTHKNMFSGYAMLNLALILFLCIELPLLPSFALYFGGWHSIRSFELIFKYLQVEQGNERLRPATLWLRSIPMTLLAALFFIAAAYAWSFTEMKGDPLPIVFIFLSVITLPHLDVMDKMIKRSTTS